MQPWADFHQADATVIENKFILASFLVIGFKKVENDMQKSGKGKGRKEEPGTRETGRLRGPDRDLLKNMLSSVLQSGEAAFILAN